MRYISIGKIVNTHGIQGELRLLSRFEYKEKVFVKGMKIYIGKEKKEEEIASYRPHKSFDMIKLKGYYNINEVLSYKGQYCYVNYEDLKLSGDECLAMDLIQLPAYSAGAYVGQVKRIEEIGNDRRLLILEHDGREVMIPYIHEFVSYNKRANVVNLTVPEGLIK